MYIFAREVAMRTKHSATKKKSSRGIVIVVHWLMKQIDQLDQHGPKINEPLANRTKYQS